MSIFLVVLAGIYLLASAGYYRTALTYMNSVGLPGYIIKPFCAVISLLWVALVGGYLIRVAASNV